MSIAKHTLHPGDTLRERMSRECVGLPGAFNGLCARAVARAGFHGCYVSGAATTAASAVPDIGVRTLDEFCRVIREVCDAARTEAGEPLPVLADADTGFGESEMARRTVIEYHRAGAAGMHLEDQVFPKRCGHLDGKMLVAIDHAVEKIAAAAKASLDCSGGSFMICARTDARGVEGMEAALGRSRAYIDAGAHMVFPEGLATAAEFGAFANALRSTHPKVYLLANMTEFGKTEQIPLSAFAAMGYSCVIWPVSMLRVAMGAVGRALAVLRSEGSVQSFINGMQTRQELYDLLGYAPGQEWEFPAR